MKYGLALLLIFAATSTYAAQEQPLALKPADALTDQQFEDLIDQLVASEEAQAGLDGDLISQASKNLRGVRRPAQSRAASMRKERSRIISAARSLAKSGQYDKASQLYFRMSRSPNFRDIAIESK